MSKQAQIKSNMRLTEDLANYLVDHPGRTNNLPNDATYVVFTEKDTPLNRANEGLLRSLKGEEKPVIRAKKTGNINSPWEFTNVSA